MTPENTNVIPEVGMGATICYNHDKYPATIVAVYKDKAGRTVITIKRDSWQIVTEAGKEKYLFTPNPAGQTRHYRLQGDTWVGVVFNETTGRWNRVVYDPIVLGKRSYFYRHLRNLPVNSW